MTTQRRTRERHRSRRAATRLLAVTALVVFTGCSEPLTARDVTSQATTTVAATELPAAATSTVVTPNPTPTTTPASGSVSAPSTSEPPEVLAAVDQPSAGSIGFTIDRRVRSITLTADGAGSDPLWDFGDGSTGRGTPISHDYRSAGDFTVTMTAADSRTATRIVRVANPPDVEISDDLTIAATESSTTNADDVAIAAPRLPEPRLSIVTRGRRVDASSDRGSVTFDRVTWDFGDGATSRASDPTHVYERSGSYVIVLVAERNDDQTITSAPVTVADGLDSVTVREAASSTTSLEAASNDLVPAFDMEVVGNFVAVTNRSTGGPFAEIRWDFGDGTAAAGRTASHRYDDVGRAIVTLYVRTSTAEASIDQPVRLDFDPPIITRQRGDEVTFGFDESANVTEATWDFGDGSAAIGPAVTHVFDEPGVATVSFTAASADGRTASRSEAIDVKGPVSADFDVVAVDCATVRLVDRSSVSVNGRLWQFGDGETSTVQSPVHTFVETGTHTVTLQATNRAYEATASADITTTCEP